MPFGCHVPNDAEWTVSFWNDTKIKVFEFQNHLPISKHLVSPNRFRKNERLIFDVETNDTTQIILEKVREKSLKLEEACKITREVNPYDKYRGQSHETISTKAYHSNFKKDATFLPEIRGRHVSSYSYKWDGKHFISYGEWLAAPRERKYFQGQRLIMRQVLGEKLNCTIIEEDMIIDQSIFIAKPDLDFKEHLNSILGVLASRLISKYFRFSSNEFDALFPKIKIGEFRELPMPKDIMNCQETIGKRVESMLELKKINTSADTADLEREIDQLVYKLYDLTEEEIKIVEGNS